MDDYVERRKEDRAGCVVCGLPLDFDAQPGSDREGQLVCSYDHSHEYNDRRKSVRCGCGKWRCPMPYPHPSAGHNRPSCEPHPKINGAHHTDGTTACETSYRTPEEEMQWQKNHAKWKAVQAKLPDLAAVLHLLDAQANPLSFDGHDNFKFVSENPEAAAICIHHMYDTLRGIQVGAIAMRSIPSLKER